MDPVLDETSLVPCDQWSAIQRVKFLAEVIQSLDQMGMPRVLRSVRDAPQRDIGSGRGLASWCYDKAVDRDAGRFVAGRLTRAPYVDGDSGLFQDAQRGFAVEAKLYGQVTLGLAVVALTGTVGVAMRSSSRASGGLLPLALTYLDEEGERQDTVSVPCIIVREDADALRQDLLERMFLAITTGPALLERAEELFPRLRFGGRAHEQIDALSGHEPIFRQLIWQLRVLNQAVSDWEEGPFEPRGIQWSVESTSTLTNGKYGPMRDFPAPEGFSQQRWSLHAKLAGGARLYFRFEREVEQGVVLIGYFGDHLPTVKYP